MSLALNNFGALLGTVSSHFGFVFFKYLFFGVFVCVHVCVLEKCGRVEEEVAAAKPRSTKKRGKRGGE